MAAPILVYAEIRQGRLSPAATELVTIARALGRVEVAALGPGARGAADPLARHGAEVINVNEDAAYSDYVAEPAADTMAALVGALAPQLILFAATYDSREVAGRLAARLGLGLIANAQEVRPSDGGFEAVVPYFGGAKLATLRLRRTPAIVMVRPKSVEATESPGAGRVVEIESGIASGSRRARVVDRVEEMAEKVSLEAASVVVSGGRGMGGPENFHLLEELADALGGAVGASRAVVDAGWVPYSMQVGQTGKTVRPAIYIACGISGAMQHTVGMKGSKVIVAINKDAEAPIVKMADLGVVGDALKILPPLIEAVRARKG